MVAAVTALPCWFTKAPEIKDAGTYYRQVSVELVDAAQALQVVLAEQKASKEKSEPLLGDFGTYTLGSASLTLTKPMEGYQDGPELALLATGNHYLTGPLVVTRTRNIEGTTTSTGWGQVRTWYESIITTSPAPATWFPIGPPSAEAEAIVEGGVKSTRYTVSVTLAEVR
jgi:hypothetical protein